MFLDMLRTDEPAYPMDAEEQRVLSITDEAEDILGIGQKPSQLYAEARPQLDKVLSDLIDNTALG